MHFGGCRCRRAPPAGGRLRFRAQLQQESVAAIRIRFRGLRIPLRAELFLQIRPLSDNLADGTDEFRRCDLQPLRHQLGNALQSALPVHMADPRREPQALSAGDAAAHRQQRAGAGHHQSPPGSLRRRRGKAGADRAALVTDAGGARRHRHPPKCTQFPSYYR